MRTVLVTGALGGIGAATVERFAGEEWNVVATMRYPEKAPWPESESLLVCRLDVTDGDSIASAVDEAVERFGGIDVVVNTAGHGQYGIFEAVSRAEVQRELEVMVLGQMEVIRAVLPHMRERGGGVIVNVGSGAGVYGIPMASIYCTSKFALEGFSEAVSYELRGVGIAVKLVIPHGGVDGTRFASGSSMPAAPEDYNDWVATSRKKAADQPAPSPVPTAQVAATIFEAATDGTDRLRYPVGNDTRGRLAAWDLPHEQREARLREIFS
jgi:NAD(P)-dependent dehydrogenase (short-subunit alcohol dehydrogenase family)